MRFANNNWTLFYEMMRDGGRWKMVDELWDEMVDGKIWNDEMVIIW